MKKFTLSIFAFAMALMVTAQTPEVVFDINTNTSNFGSTPIQFTKFHDKIYFEVNAEGLPLGAELWVYDTINFPSLFMDIYPGPKEGSPQNYCIFDDKLFFTAQDGINGYELWAYDGIDAPTMAADIYPGDVGSSPYGLTVFNNNLYFIAQGSVTEGRELWVFDGTSAPTLVADIYPGPNYANIYKLIVFNNKLYFNANDGTNGSELWEYDGINPPTMTANIYSGSSSSSPQNFAIFNNKLYFSASTAAGNYLYLLDETNSLTLLVGSPRIPSFPFVFNDKLYFAARPSSTSDLWQYDGISAPQFVAQLAPDGNSYELISTAVTEDAFYFRRQDVTNQYKLYKCDTNNTITIVSDLNPGHSDYVQSITAIDNKIYFAANDGVHGTEMWVYDRVNPPVMFDLYDRTGNAEISGLVPFNNELYFKANDGLGSNNSLWKYDAMNNPTIVPGSEGSGPQDMIVYNGKLYFAGYTSLTGSELMVYDGINPVDTVADMCEGCDFGPMYLTLFNDKLFFTAYIDSTGYELFSYDGIGLPVMVADINPVSGNGSEPYNLTVFNNKLYFTAYTDVIYDELWVYDGVNPPTLVADICNSCGASPDHLIVFNDKLYFEASDGINGSEIWEYDGLNPPVMAIDVAPGSNSPDITMFYVFNNKLIYGANDDSGSGTELWEYDGTNPPVMVTDIYPGSENSNPEEFIVADNNLFFSANNGSYGNEMWMYDGTNPPLLYADIYPGILDGYPQEYTIFDNKLYFIANDESAGRELFRICYKTSASVAPSTCGSYLSPSGNYVWDVSGIYLDTIENVSGCDSVITFDLTINSADTSVTNNSPTLTANASGATYQWLDCNNGNLPIPDENGQSFTATVNGNYAVIVDDGCIGTSGCFAVLNVGTGKNITTNNFLVYPNPGNGIYKIETNFAPNTHFVVTDLSGRILQEGTITTSVFDIDISRFDNGFYILKADNKLVKLIKQ